MNANINTHALRQTCIDSTKLSVLGSVMHLVPDEGIYQGTVLNGRTEVGSFRFEVDDKASATQADVALSSIASEAPELPPIQPGGYLVLYVPQGPGGYQVRLQKLGTQRPRTVFDSRKLGQGDIFAATLLRPGKYEMRSSVAKDVLRINVAYPVSGRGAYTPAPPVQVRLTKKGFDTKLLELGAAQAITVMLDVDGASVLVDCVKPDDGPRGGGDRRTRRNFPPHERD